MGYKSKISWTNATLNWATGCTPIDPRICKVCYAMALYPRLKGMGLPTYQWEPNEVHVHEAVMKIPLQWMKPRRIFVNSMSDAFHEAIPFEIIDKFFDVVRQTPRHKYQILTKRSHRMFEYGRRIGRFPDNAWLGVSVGTKEMRFKIDHLRQVDAKTRFLSCEPLLESIAPLDLTGIQWVIVGGISGPHWREYAMDPQWAREIRDQCVKQGISFYFKQSSAFRAGLGAELDGKVWHQFPNGLGPQLL